MRHGRMGKMRLPSAVICVLLLAGLTDRGDAAEAEIGLSSPVNGYPDTLGALICLQTRTNIDRRYSTSTPQAGWQAA